MPANLSPEYIKAEKEYRAANSPEEKLVHLQRMHTVSALTGVGLDALRKRIYELLRVMRVFSKDHGTEPDRDAPFTIPIGATVLDFAGAVHRDFADHFKSARVWGSAKFDGQAVQRDHVLQDGDVVELTMGGL